MRVSLTPPPLWTDLVKLYYPKHPEPRKFTEKGFLPCDKLPSLVDIDVTAAHVEKVAWLIKGSTGPGGTMALHWQDILLR